MALQNSSGSPLGACGLLCFLCQDPEKCNCHSNNHCGKRLAPQGCYQYTCSSSKGFSGCWECEQAPCDIDMHAEGKVKIRAFITCIKENGLETFLHYIDENTKRGIVYHREGIFGDYDLETEAEVLTLLRSAEIPVSQV